MSEHVFITGQFVRIGQDLANVGRRILSTLLDLLIMMGASGVVISFVAIFIRDVAVIQTIYIAMVVLFPLVMERLLKGRSIGKMAARLKVVSADGSNPSFTASLLRWALFWVDVPTGLGVVSILFTENNQRIGDLAAGTYVVQQKASFKLKAISPQQFPPYYQPVYPQAANLSQRQMEVIGDAYYLYGQDSEQLRSDLANKICKMLQINVYGVDSRTFFRQLLYDFQYMTYQEALRETS